MLPHNVYSFWADASGRVYTFESIGRTRLTKKVIFTAIDSNYFNVELRTETDDDLLPDTEVSNNGDAYVVFATVAAIIEAFLEKHPATLVHLKGSDDRRQRIYQAMLMKAAEEKRKLGVFGIYTDGRLEPLKAGILYDACFVIKL